MRFRNPFWNGQGAMLVPAAPGIPGMGEPGEKGDPGDVSSVCGVEPDEEGDVPLNYGDLFNRPIWNEVPAGDIDGVNLIFAFANTPIPGKLLVYINGLIQEEGVDYTIDGTDLTFAEAPEPGDKVAATYEYSI